MHGGDAQGHRAQKPRCEYLSIIVHFRVQANQWRKSHRVGDVVGDIDGLICGGSIPVRYSNAVMIIMSLVWRPEPIWSRWSGWSKTFWPAFHCIGHGFLFGPISKDWLSGMVCSVKPNNFWLPSEPPTQIHPGGPIDFVKGFILPVPKFGFLRTTDTSKTVF